MNSEQILTMVKAILVEEFEIDAEDIVPEANIYQDLDIDSIDVVDLVVRLRTETGKVIKPENFKQVRTIKDLTDALESMMQE